MMRFAALTLAAMICGVCALYCAWAAYAAWYASDIALASSAPAWPWAMGAAAWAVAARGSTA